MCDLQLEPGQGVQHARGSGDRAERQAIMPRQDCRPQPFGGPQSIPFRLRAGLDAEGDRHQVTIAQGRPSGLRTQRIDTEQTQRLRTPLLGQTQRRDVDQARLPQMGQGSIELFPPLRCRHRHTVRKIAPQRFVQIGFRDRFADRQQTPDQALVEPTEGL